MTYCAILKVNVKFSDTEKHQPQNLIDCSLFQSLPFSKITQIFFYNPAYIQTHNLLDRGNKNLCNTIKNMKSVPVYQQKKEQLHYQI